VTVTHALKTSDHTTRILDQHRWTSSAYFPLHLLYLTLMSSLTPLKASTLSLKPHKNEAALRIRNSSAAVVAVLFLTHLTPAPSLWTAVDVVLNDSGEGKSAFWMMCAAGECPYSNLSIKSSMTVIRVGHTRSFHPERPSGSYSAHVSTNTSPTRAVTFEEHQDTTVTLTKTS
jgi:hypothetical protein